MLSVRKIIEEARRTELARAEAERRETEQRRADLEARRRRAARALVAAGRRLRGAELGLHADCEQTYRRLDGALAESIEKQLGEEQGRREDLLDAALERRAIEHVEGRWLQARAREAARRERKLNEALHLITHRRRRD